MLSFKVKKKNDLYGIKTNDVIAMWEITEDASPIYLKNNVHKKYIF